MTRRRAAVLGSPIGYSLSPVLHRAAYAALGLDWEYDAIECDEAALPGTLERFAETYRGLSLTMPLKRAVLPLLDDVDPLAAAAGAVNTVLFVGGRRVGFNTDVQGILGGLAELGFAEVSAAVVLGGGATAASALAALARLGGRRPHVVVRHPDRVSPLREAAARLGSRPRIDGWDRRDVVWEAPLVVSTVPAGVTDGLAGEAPWRPDTALLDVVYAPWPTRLAAAAAAAGAPVVGGLSVLVGQGAEQVRLMTGRPPPVSAMRTAGEAALAQRAQSSGRPGAPT